MFRHAVLVQSGFEGLGVQPIRFQGVGSSADQILRSWEFDQSVVEERKIQPIRF
jgi:hypothetical protein